uniref:Uncharacterized protein n=1 Tax=Glossina palpalis gambiensis TaxID=67801 RepID=A0A1B0BXQ7_9MUSC
MQVQRRFHDKRTKIESSDCLTIYMSMFTYVSLNSVLMISISSNSSTMTVHDIANCRTPTTGGSKKERCVESSNKA